MKTILLFLLLTSCTITIHIPESKEITKKEPFYIPDTIGFDTIGFDNGWLNIDKYDTTQTRTAIKVKL